jgi:hypothetical protein
LSTLSLIEDGRVEQSRRKVAGQGGRELMQASHLFVEGESRTRSSMRFAKAGCERGTAVMDAPCVQTHGIPLG